MQTTSIRYDVGLFMRFVRGLPVLAAYIGIIIVLIITLPREKLNIPLQSFAAVGIIGLWRYLWLMTHVIRAHIFEHFAYPKLRFEADDQPEESKFPKRCFFVIPTYGEVPEVSKRMLHSILDEVETVPTVFHLVINAGSDEEDEIFRESLAEHASTPKVEVHFIRQKGGKRQGMADVLNQLMHVEHDFNDCVVLMDGDTLLGKGIMEKCLTLFTSRPKLGAVTTDNISYTKGSWFYRKWYTLRFAMRHRMMKSQSLSRQIMVLTGRFSMFRAPWVFDDEFVSYLENDRIKHWLHGEIKFVTGDDKSTWFCLLKRGAEMLYVPDAHIFCMEDSGKAAVLQSVQKMHRWFGNMLRNNGRAIGLGVGRQKAFIWWCAIDQRISIWTSLMGPVTALWAALLFGWEILIVYLILVIFIRTIYLLLLLIEGHRLSMSDIPLLLYTQWGGSMVKSYTLFHLHRQKWSSHRSKDSAKKQENFFQSVVPKFQIGFSYLLLFVVVVILVEAN